MIRKINKKLVITFIMVMTFMIKINSVYANDKYECDFISPFTYLNKNSVATKIQIELYYKELSLNKLSVIPDSVYYCFNCDTPITNKGIGRFVITERSSYETIDSLCVSKYENKYWPSFKTTDKLTYKSDDTNINQQIFKLDRFWEASKYSDVFSSDYIRVYADEGKGREGFYKVEKSTKSEYEKFLKEKLYENITLEKHDLYSIMSLKNIKSYDMFTQGGGCDGGYNCTFIGINSFKDKSNNYYKFIKNMGGIILVNKSVNEKYPDDNYKEFTTALKGKDGGQTAIDNLSASGADGYPLVLDGSKYNNYSHTKAYYDATKSRWREYMKNDINNPKKASSQRKEIFRKWYNYTNRYIFEDDLELFKKYFMYLYPKDDDTAMKELGGGSVESGKNNYQLYVDAIDGIIGVKDANDKISEYNDQNCTALCPINNTVAKEQCKKNNKDYINCAAADKNCKAKCKNVPGNDNQKCFDSCMKGALGEEAYNSLQDKKKEREKELEEAKDAAINKIIDSLSRVDLPSFNGIEFNEDGYEVVCDDVVIFHKFYNILRVFAPILVILFGTLDYAKSVMGADEAKVLEFRKKFPKRLILLVLFVAIPVLLNVIIGFFAPFDSNKSLSLMRCIISGK